MVIILYQPLCNVYKYQSLRCTPETNMIYMWIIYEKNSVPYGQTAFSNTGYFLYLLIIIVLT